MLRRSLTSGLSRCSASSCSSQPSGSSGSCSRPMGPRCCGWCRA